MSLDQVSVSESVEQQIIKISITNWNLKVIMSDNHATRKQANLSSAPHLHSG